MKFSFLKFNTRSALKKNKANRSSLPYNQALNVGIIFSADDKTKHDDVKDFIRRLEEDGKQVKVISYLPKKKDKIDVKFDFFTDKDLSFWGKINSAQALQFAEAAFDFLYYLDTVPNPLILNILARSKANCRIGKLWDDNMGFFELMIETKTDGRIFMDHLYTYTSQLR